MRILSVAGAIALASLPSAASAEATANEMLKRIDAGQGTELITVWLGAGASALNWANIELVKGRSAQPLYCPPEKLALTHEQSVQILRDFVREKPHYGEGPAGLAMMKALMATFPCKTGL